MTEKDRPATGRTAALFHTPRLPVTIGVILAFLVTVLTVVYGLQWPLDRPTVAFLAAALAAAGAIAGAFYIGRTLHVHLEREARTPQDAAFRYMERWNDPAMFHARHVCREIIDTLGPQGPEKVKEDLDKNLEKRTNVGHILNFLEELSVAVQMKRTDETLTRRQFEGLAIRLYQLLTPWIEEQRRIRGRPKLWVEIQWLYENWGPGKG